jgi:CheY-like chemotaxis protein/anti-sigma regulatory factor (Ser/Thr protein kinase)
MSHELRTPLNTILGLSEALLEEVYGTLSEKQSASLKTIEESGRHLLELINDILDLAKIEAGKVDLQIDVVDISAVCASSLRLIKQPAFKKNLHIIERLDPAAMTIQADERRLKQILVNLLSNAVKFTPSGGQIGLEVTGDPEQGIIQFAVWDTGIGIAPEYLDRLFRPFVQIDSSLTRQHAGTGLGLSLVGRLTNMHGGSVMVESTPDNGSRFTISLPWIQQLSPLAMTMQEESADTLPLTWLHTDQFLRPVSQAQVIVLAEDNEASIVMVSEYLQARGYQVVAARNGDEALKRIWQTQPVLVLMDIQMPVMDGLEALRRMRASGNQTPVIALTAMANTDDRDRCLSAGATDYLSKPVKLKQLIEMIDTYLS